MKKLTQLVAILLAAFSGSTAMAQIAHTKPQVLVLIYSDTGGTYALAREVAAGITGDGLVDATIKQVKASPKSDLKDVPVATVAELARYDGIAFGSPVYFGNISTPMSEFLSQTGDLWSAHALEGKPATVFMSAGSGAGKELAFQSFWGSLAVHGMLLMPNGIRGVEGLDKTVPQGNSVLGASTLASLKNVERSTLGERQIARDQGRAFARVVSALRGALPASSSEAAAMTEVPKAAITIREALARMGLALPPLPKPAGNYSPFVRTGNLVFINQYALKDGKILHPGKIGVDVTDAQAKESVQATMLNVLSVLNEAVGGDLGRVKQAVQLTGVFNTIDTYADHARLMNTASDLAADLLGERGHHARMTLGANSVPGQSPVEIQAIFEVE